VDAHAQSSEESHNLALSREKTVPLHHLQEKEGDTATLKLMMNNQRQSEQHTNA